MKTSFKFVVFLFVLAGCTLFCVQNTYAGSSLIPYASILWNSGIDSDGGTTFGVSISFGGACEGVCETYGSFRCTKKGYAYTTCISDSQTDVTYSASKTNAMDDGYDYYWVDFYPCDSSQQTVGGYIRKPNQKTLTAHGKIEGDTATIVWSDIASRSVRKGASASVTVDNEKTKDGRPYEFVEWGASCKPNNDNDYNATNSGRTCTVNPLNRNVNVYAYYDLKKFTLTAYANSLEKDKNGDYIKLNGGKSIDSAQAKYGSNASVTSAGFNPDGYSWYRWGDSCDRETDRRCTRNNLTSDKNVYAYYIKNKFKGQASVTSGGRTETTGFVNTNKKDANAALLKVDCPESGCSASFALSLMPEAGSGETTYTIYGNGNQIAGHIQRVVKPATAGTDVYTVTVDMQAGDLVCYKMEFSTVPVEGKKATVEACAAAEADKDSDISIELRDQDSSADYWDWREDYVYAKPNDTVELHGAFEPRYQYLANKSSSVTSIILDEDNGTSKSGLNNNGEPILGVFNNNMNPSWNNAFSITVKGECKDTFSPFDYENRVGNTGSYDGNYNYSVATYDMGKIEAKSKTNNCDVAKNTPKGASLIYNTSNRRFEATVNNSSIDDAVSIYVPYNFQNETKVTTEENKIVYAGESDDFDIAVETYPRANPLTNGTYATTFNNAKLKVRLCNENETSCYGEEEVDISGLNIGKTYSTQMIAENARIKMNIPDIDAGSMVCLRSMMYPADSGSYDNWQNSEGSATWTDWSDKKCFKVAKRPSLQVWGGSVYSAGMIDMKPSAKNNLYGYENYRYKMIEQGEHRVFGSWAELSLAANGDVNGLASGAGTGYARTENARTVGALDPTLENLGGSAEGINVNYCLRSTLSFANTSCNKIVGGLGGGGLQSEVSSSKRALVSRFVDENSEGYTLEKTSEINDGYLRSYSGDMETGEDGVEKKKTTRVIVSEGDVTINGDITYLDNGYSNLEDVPKIIIYAKNDINIACEVAQIDAILIAENNINTCSDSDDINAEMNSKQLKINGSVISNTLTLNRTYGAAKGVNSVIPAEIVNYDTSLYLWANKQADVTTSGKLTEAYISELAPRY